MLLAAFGKHLEKLAISFALSVCPHEKTQPPPDLSIQIFRLGSHIVKIRVDIFSDPSQHSVARPKFAHTEDVLQICGVPVNILNKQ
jgi:hypothetical protein